MAGDSDKTIIYNEQIARWQRLGPVRYRLRELLVVLALSVVWLVVALSGVTLISLYRGTGSVYLGPTERPALAEVDECRRVGPVSVNGFGYWWECRVVVRTDDGRVVRVRVSKSIVTPDDAGRQVEFREACWGADNTKCSYGRPVNSWWGLLALILDKALWLFTLLFATFIVAYTARAALGAPRFYALVKRFSRSSATAASRTAK